MSQQDERDLFGPRRLSDALPKVKPLSRVKQRLIESAVQIEAEDPDSIPYQHTVFCQTGLPYRDPGSEVREWEREQGTASLLIEAGKAMDPESGKWIELGLTLWSQASSDPLLPQRPGPQDRLVRNRGRGQPYGFREAAWSRVQGSQYAHHQDPAWPPFRGNDPSCRHREALELSRSTTKVVGAFDLWFPKDQRQRVLWPSTVRLSSDYFDSLQRHAVPLDERAIAALSHSAMGLDMYAWLAQRLHRVDL